MGKQFTEVNILLHKNERNKAGQEQMKAEIAISIQKMEEKIIKGKRKQRRKWQQDKRK